MFKQSYFAHDHKLIPLVARVAPRLYFSFFLQGLRVKLNTSKCCCSCGLRRNFTTFSCIDHFLFAKIASYKTHPVWPHQEHQNRKERCSSMGAIYLLITINGFCSMVYIHILIYTYIHIHWLHTRCCVTPAMLLVRAWKSCFRADNFNLRFSPHQAC